MRIMNDVRGRDLSPHNIERTRQDARRILGGAELRDVRDARREQEQLRRRARREAIPR